MDEFPQLSSKHYQTVYPDICSGDILLCSGNSIFSTFIKKATHSVWSHVAFILRLDVIDRIVVLESVESLGVRVVPLSHYICNYNNSGQGYPGKLMLARHADITQNKIPALSTLAVDYLGYPYGKEEIIHIAARIGLHNLGISNLDPDPIKQKAFICSEYAQLCFSAIGINIECNRIGFIAPADFAIHPKIKPLCYLQTESEMATCVPVHGMQRHASR